jgi:hypothetical protein
MMPAIKNYGEASCNGGMYNVSTYYETRRKPRCQMRCPRRIFVAGCNLSAAARQSVAPLTIIMYGESFDAWQSLLVFGSSPPVVRFAGHSSFLETPEQGCVPRPKEENEQCVPFCSLPPLLTWQLEEGKREEKVSNLGSNFTHFGDPRQHFSMLNDALIIASPSLSSPHPITAALVCEPGYVALSCINRSRGLQ